MARTLSQAAELCQDKMIKGVIEEILYTSPLINLVPFVDLKGNALSINRESTLPTVQWRAPGGTWTESTGVTTGETFALKILGGDADTDNFVATTRSNINDQHAVDIQMKSKAMAHEWEDCMMYGVASGSNEFDGFHTLVDSAMQLHMGSDGVGAALTTTTLDQAIDLVSILAKPTFILMNKNLRRRLTTYLRGIGSYATERDEFGKLWQVWGDGIPIVPTDWLVQTEDISGATYDAKTGGLTSSIFVGFFGEGDGLVGLQNGGITKEHWEKLEVKDAMRTRLKWYVGLAMYSTKCLCRIDGITDAAITA